MKYLAHLISDVSITIFTDTETLTVPSSHLSFEHVANSLNAGDYELAVKASAAAAVFNEFGQGKVTVKDGVILYNGDVIDNSLTKRIVSMIRQGHTVDPLVKFLDNLMQNPSGRAVQELYRFLESNNLAITEDGYFVAYKNVNDNYMDKHSGTFRNMVGDTVAMPRNQVMDDPNQTCAPGLHFCSIEYLRGFWGDSGHTMVIKINPADVVSIPTDYNNSKGRCCKYQVIAEHHQGNKEDTLSESAVYYYEEDDEFGYYDDEGFYVFYDDDY